jgi:hypothetical protein
MGDLNLFHSIVILSVEPEDLDLDRTFCELIFVERASAPPRVVEHKSLINHPVREYQQRKLPNLPPIVVRRRASFDRIKN